MAGGQITEIEQKLGLADLARYTTAPPPAAPQSLIGPATSASP